MQAEIVSVIQQLVGVQRAVTLRHFLATTTNFGSVAAYRSLETGACENEQVVSHIGCELEVFQEFNLSSTTCTQVVDSVFDDTCLQLSHRVIVGRQRSVVLVSLLASCIILNVAICIVFVDRINRGNVLREHKQVAVVRANLIGKCAHLGFCVCNVTLKADVASNFVLNFQTRTSTIETRVCNVAIIVEV